MPGSVTLWNNLLQEALKTYSLNILKHYITPLFQSKQETLVLAAMLFMYPLKVFYKL